MHNCVRVHEPPKEVMVSLREKILLRDLGEIENMLCFIAPYEDLRTVHFRKMSSFSADFFWLSDHKRLKLYFRKKIFFVTEFTCRAWEETKY